ncbi:SEC23-interacting protein [Trichoplax sp. H2]|nr:SEC23-interacting protein [Trichoplax sp. H2]|eukprot:RDD37977.1 SEC23-interacting protein [Trichoplax sp. H2]
MADKDTDANPLSSFSNDGSHAATVPFLLCPPTEDISLSQQTTSQSDQTLSSYRKEEASTNSDLANASVADIPVEAFVGQDDSFGQSKKAYLPSTEATYSGGNTGPPPPTASLSNFRQDPNKQRYQQVPTYQPGSSQSAQVPLYNMAGPVPPANTSANPSQHLPQQQTTQIFHPETNTNVDTRYDFPVNNSNDPLQQQQQQYQQEYDSHQTASMQAMQQQQQHFPYGGELQPMVAHWFYKREDGAWVPFTRIDSGRIEEHYINNTQGVVTTDGGRFDVDVKQRIRYPIYWNGSNVEVRRGTWFYRSDQNSYLIPYEETVSEKLEALFHNCINENRWQQSLPLDGGESVVIHSPTVMIHMRPNNVWNQEESTLRPRAVKRSVADIYYQLPEGEKDQIDHLILVIHGIGQFADFQLRDIVACVEDLRNNGINLQQTHASFENNRAGRVEFLPIIWRYALHGDDNGVDSAMKDITLPSITRMRNFTNENLLDILFYTSPVYCQAIVNYVTQEMNRIYKLFRERNPNFVGQVSISGHSLGSCIAFDLLRHQGDVQQMINQSSTVTGHKSETARSFSSKSENELVSADSASEKSEVSSLVGEETNKLSDKEEEEKESISTVLAQLNLSAHTETFENEQIDLDALVMCSESDLKDLGLPLGHRKKLSNYIKKTLEEKSKQEAAAAEAAKKKEAKKSAVSTMQVSENEPSINLSESIDLSRQGLASHNANVERLTYQKGVAGTGQPYVNYPRLDFRQANFFALGSPIGLFLIVRGIDNIDEKYKLPTCSRFYNVFHPAYRIEPIIEETARDILPVMMEHHKGRKRFHLELKDNLTKMGKNFKRNIISSVQSTITAIQDFARAHTGTKKEEGSDLTEHESEMQQLSELIDTKDQIEDNVEIGQLNEGNRIDYVLQEAPLESLNEYLFALSSHCCYWTSEDTAFFILRKLYSRSELEPSSPTF